MPITRNDVLRVQQELVGREIWRRTDRGWVIVYHQGTIVEREPTSSPTTTR